jgi:hypothetical protein
MDKIYPKNNYLVIENDGNVSYFPQKTSVFYIQNDSIIVSTNSSINTTRNEVIEISRISNYYDESGSIAYSFDTLIDLLTDYTSKIS